MISFLVIFKHSLRAELDKNRKVGKGLAGEVVFLRGGKWTLSFPRPHPTLSFMAASWPSAKPMEKKLRTPPSLFTGGGSLRGF